MRKKLLLLFLFAILLNLALISFQSCCSSRNGSDMCSVISGMDIKILDNADSTVHDPSGQVIAKAMVLQLNLRDSMISCAANRPAYYGFINTTYACCKRWGGYDILDTLIISSNHDFDAAHPAGTNLKDLFYIQNESALVSSGSHNCYLRSAPDDTGTHIFNVHMVVHYEDGGYNSYSSSTTRKVLNDTTQPIKLLK